MKGKQNILPFVVKMKTRTLLEVHNLKIEYIHKYLYLGAWFSDDASMSTVLSMHETSNETQLNKFAIFCSANANMPYAYKRMVFEAAMTSSLLYSS